MKLKYCSYMLLLILSVLSSNGFALDLFKSINDSKNLKSPEVNNEFTNDIYRKFTEDFVIEFIYSSQCSFCHKLSYVLNELKKDNKISVSSITVDGGVIGGFEDAVYSEKFIRENDIKAFPTLIARHKNNQRYLLAQGYVSENELRNNIQALLDFMKGVINE